MSELKKILIECKGYTASEASSEIREAKDIMREYLENGDMSGAYDICEEMWGLEPDYLMDLM